MKQRLWIGLALTLLPGLAAAQAADSGMGMEPEGKPAAACEKQHAQCMKQCDKKKTLWFFKGEAFDSCAARCEERRASCMATGTGGPEADRDRMREHAEDGAGGRGEEMMHEGREAAREAREQGRAHGAQAREQAAETAAEARSEAEEQAAEAAEEDEAAE